MNPLLLTNTSAMAAPSVWLFGYGSLIWNAGFEFDEARKVFVDGYSRRFWQGNTMHRGTPSSPGRVVTIIEQAGERVYGLAYRVSGESAIRAALKHLYYREVENGYDFEPVALTSLAVDGESYLGLTCVARPQNEFFLGPAPTERETARQIASASGAAGPNHEYLLKLAANTRKLFPEVVDDHLFRLETLVTDMLASRAKSVAIMQ